MGWIVFSGELLILLLVTHSLCNEEPEHRVELCWNEDFQESCADGVLVITSAKYGRHRVTTCTGTAESVPCSTDVLPLIDARCSGRQSCEFEVKELHDLHACPRHLAAELYLTYQCKKVYMAEDNTCIPNSNISINISNGPGITIPSLVSYNTNKGTSRCPWAVSTVPGRQINVVLTNFKRFYNNDLGNFDKTCYRYARITEKGHPEKIIAECESGERHSLVYTSKTHEIQVEIMTTAASDIYYLLEFQATGCKPNWPTSTTLWIKRIGDKALVRCNATGEEWTLTCLQSEGRWIGTYDADCPADVGNGGKNGYMAHEPERFPYGILIVVAIGVALGVFLGGLLLICAARFIKRKQNPGNRNPNHEIQYAPTADYIPREDLQQYITEQKCPLSGTYERCHTAVVSDKDKFQHQCYGTLPAGHPASIIKPYGHLYNTENSLQEPRDPV